MEGGVHNYAEYSVVQKKEGKNRRNRILLIFLYVFFGIAYFGAVVATNLIPLGAILPLLEWMLVYFTWRYVQVEHEYTIATGLMTFTEIYANKYRNVKLEVDCREMSRIAPIGINYDGEFSDAEILYDFRGSLKSPDSYFAIFSQGNKKAAVLFEANTKVVKLLKLYNPSATVVSNTLRF